MDDVPEFSNVRFKRKGELRDANAAAQEEAGNTAGFVLPGMLFRQGERYSISTAFPVKQVLSSLEVNAADKRGDVSHVLSKTNRPVMTEHVASIADYLIENVGRKYILPPMTLNVQQPISVYGPDYQSDFMPVYVVIPRTARLSVTDGGHRQKAIVRAHDQMNEDQRSQFERDSVSVMITLESKPEQVHQDFADCSKTKALPLSQLAAYDRRNPANGLVLDIVEHCPLFMGKIDATSKTLSKLSNQLFLTNQVRQLVKELLVGDYGLADPQFEAKAKEILGNSDSEAYAREYARFVEFVNRVTRVIPVLKSISELPAGIPQNMIKDYRTEGHICLTATGLVIIGRIGHELFKEQIGDWERIADRLGEIDWSRDADIWQGNIVRAGKMTTQRAPVKVAAEKVRRLIGLTANLRMDDQVSGMNRGDAVSEEPAIEEAA